MSFVTPDSSLFSGLSDSTAVLHTADGGTYIHSVIIYNRTDKEIRVNLKVVRTLNVPEPIEVFTFGNVILRKNETVDLISLKDITLFLKDADSLLCFSNGYHEKFDCHLYYGVLNNLNQIM
jgi:hypothetical protein